jgi:hypothetical protein
MYNENIIPKDDNFEDSGRLGCDSVKLGVQFHML